LKPIDESLGVREDLLETVYETGAPLMSRALTELGAVVKTSANATDANSGKGRKTYSLYVLQRVGCPSEGEYLNHSLMYKCIFLYNCINAWSKTGIVAVFFLNNGRHAD
jgi:hypothetical protein